MNCPTDGKEGICTSCKEFSTLCEPCCPDGLVIDQRDGWTSENCDSDAHEFEAREAERDRQFESSCARGER